MAAFGFDRYEAFLTDRILHSLSKKQKPPLTIGVYEQSGRESFIGRAAKKSKTKIALMTSGANSRRAAPARRSCFDETLRMRIG